MTGSSIWAVEIINLDEHGVGFSKFSEVTSSHGLWSGMKSCELVFFREVSSSHGLWSRKKEVVSWFSRFQDERRGDVGNGSREG